MTGANPAASSPSLDIQGDSAKRSLAIDVIRGVAILLVLPHHPVVSFEQAGVFRTIARKFEWFGWIGVDIFFVLSGFLIGSLLFREIIRTGQIDAPRFLARRAFKIWPGYYALLTVAMSAQFVLGKTWHEVIHSFWPNLIHLQNYVHPADGLGHTWSLAVEEHFYLFLPLLLGILKGQSAKTDRIRMFPLIAILTLIFVAIFRLIHAACVPYFIETHYAPTHLRIDALLIGVLLAWTKSYRSDIFQKLISHRALLLILSILILVPLSRTSRTDYFVHTIGFSISYIAAAMLVLLALGSEQYRGSGYALFKSPPGTVVTTIGRWSYGIYLWHIFAGNITRDLAANFWSGLNPTTNYITTTFVYITIATAIGGTMTLIVETPMLNLRDRIFKKAEGKIQEGTLAVA